MKLIKCSIPDWELEVDSEDEAARLLWPHICGLCRTGSEFEDAKPVSEHDLHGMLGTACGCEYDFQMSETEALVNLKSELERVLNSNDFPSLHIAYNYALYSGIFDRAFDSGVEEDD